MMIFFVYDIHNILCMHDNISYIIYIMTIFMHTGKEPQRGICLLPKRTVDTGNAEIQVHTLSLPLTLSLSLSHSLTVSLSHCLTLSPLSTIRTPLGGLLQRTVLWSRRVAGVRCRANMAHIRQSDSGLGFRDQILALVFRSKSYKK